MSDRLSRKEIKQKDGFQESMIALLDFLENNSRKIIYGVLAVVALVVLVVAVRFVLDQRAEAAQVQLTDAIEVFSAPIVAENATSGDADALSFADLDSRSAAAKEKFEGVVDAYGSTVAGAVAKVYLGRIASQNGDLDSARELWQTFVDDRPGHMLTSEVEMNLVTLDRQMGKDEEVATRLESVLENNSSSMPQDAILYQLAETLDALGRQDEATPYYQRIVDEHPGSPYTILAQQKVTERDATVPVPS